MDNGVGFDTATINPGSSLNKTRERVEACGGPFNISSQLNVGTQLTASGNNELPFYGYYQLRAANIIA
jgi:signal transduction histidine kinase